MRTNLRSVTLLLSALAMSTTLLATMDSQKAFVAKYPEAKAKLNKCTTCHVKPLPKKEDKASHELNAYGAELAKHVIDPKAEKKTYDFAAAEAMDSDGDGVKNIDEIKAGTNPGAK